MNIIKIKTEKIKEANMKNKVIVVGLNTGTKDTKENKHQQRDLNEQIFIEDELTK